MKNIHILPTDKPSRLYLTTKEYIFEKEYSLSTDECQNKHIYITSDEKIKEGDWVLLNYPKGVEIDKALPVKLENSFHNADFWLAENKIHNCNHRKIILTNNTNLIKDGVQAINDEFLDWFVKNPSCEKVDVKSLLSNNSRALFGCKIIIPRETLEEAGKNYIENIMMFSFNSLETKTQANRMLKCVEFGAKWQVEQFLKFIQDEDHHTEGELGNSCIDVQTLIHFVNQFKKK